jgi:hypothetical protein
MGRVPLINSGGASSGAGDLKEAVMTAVINKRAGGMGLISGRKAFQRPMKEGAALLHAIQDVYLDGSRDGRLKMFLVSWLTAITRSASCIPRRSMSYTCWFTLSPERSNSVA